MFKLLKTKFDQLYEFRYFFASDDRGTFIKPFVLDEIKSIFSSNAETYFSSSKKGVLRGLHYQTGKLAQKKIVVCLEGSIEDIALDLRKNSKTYGQLYRKKIDAFDGSGVIIPSGFAHGIFAHKNSIIVNFCDKPYSPENENGIHWNSLPDLKDLKVDYLSEKDKILPGFKID